MTQTLKLRQKKDEKEEQEVLDAPEPERKKKNKKKKNKNKKRDKRKKKRKQLVAFEERSVVEILDIVFAYNNYQLIELLTERGAAITNCDWGATKEAEEKISKLIMIDENTVNEENYNNLTTPVTAFITFNSDDGLNEALMYKKAEEFYEDLEGENFVSQKIFGQDFEFTQATEPSNIIWENRHIKGVNYYLRISSALLIAFIMLLISFSFIILSK